MKQVLEDLLANNSDNFRRIDLPKHESCSCETSHHGVIFMVSKGAVTVQYGIRQPVRVASNYMVVVPALTVFNITVETETDMTIMFIRKDLAITETPLWSAIIGRAKIDGQITPLAVDKLLWDLIEQIGVYRKAGIKATEIYRCKVDEFMLLIRSIYDHSQLVEFFNPLALNEIGFEDFVRYNYSRVHNVEEFAQLAGCSVSTFKRRFAKHFPIPAYRWIQVQRSKLILQDLANNVLSLKQIADKHGFTSPSHLNRFCKNYFGTSPSVMRKEFEKADQSDRR
ncbi:MAG: helix-turn-helix transcriptional regulator [Rikenellaceae bacterium]|nr:helix-turn-helix transcriptional regulator [Rikenellaceae bacterium]MDE7355945.1 helix-turn-helix transcriptional regulator [Rikenellaceae bacterium]